MAAVRVIMHWLLLPYIVTAVTGNIVVRPNVGVLFVPTPAPQTAILHWHHTFALSLNLSVSSNSSTEGFKDTISCPNGTSICPNLLALANLQHETTARITDQLLLTKDQIIHLMSLPATKRMRRGWFNIIGKGAKSLFGLATEDDVKILKLHIAKLQNMLQNGNHNRIVDIKQLHSFQLKASDRMDKLATHLTTVDDVLINMTRQFTHLRQYANQYINLQNTVIRHQNVLGEIINFVSWNSNSKLQLISLIETYNIFQALLHDIPHLIQGKLTPNIISPIILDQLLSTIDHELLNTNSNLQVACDSTYFYENIDTVVTTLHDNMIYLKLKIPVVTKFRQFSFFHVEILPVPVHSEQDSYTIVKNMAPFLLLSADNHTFLELTSNEFANLFNSYHPRTFVPELVNSNSCVLNVFFDIHDSIAHTCKIDLLHDPLLPQNFLHLLSPNEFLIYAPLLQWTISCPDSPDKSVIHKGLFVIKLPCKCQLTSADSLFTAVDMQCVSTQQVIQYSVNWFVYTALYRSAVPHELHPSVLHDQPINFQIPQFLLNSSKLRSLEKQDNISNKHALELFNISTSETDSMTLTDWLMLTDSSSYSIIVAGVMAVINLALIPVIIYLYRKFNALQQLVMASAASLKSTEALQLTLPPLGSTTTICPPVLLPKINFSLILLICAILVGVALFLLRHKCRSLCRSSSLATNSIPLQKIPDQVPSSIYPSLDNCAPVNNCPSAPIDISPKIPSISLNFQ